MSDTLDTYDLTPAEILLRCGDHIPVNTRAGAAIEAHKMAVRQRQSDKVRWMTLTAVILASGRSVADDRAKLDYLAALPEAAWPPSPAPFCAAREDQLMAIRRSIAWRMAN